MKTPDLSQYAPVGIDLNVERQIFSIGMILVVLRACFRFFWCYYAKLAENNLYRWVGDKQIIAPGAKLSDFITILDQSEWLTGFFVLALCLFAFLPLHYAYHHQGSKSVYLMRRLPDKWEYHRRCLALPLTGIALCALTAFLLFLIFFSSYMLLTPDELLEPGQWQKIWR